MADSFGVGADSEPLIFLVDGAGGSYAMPRSMAEAHRASDAIIAAVDHLVAEHAATDEVSGYDLSPRALVSCTVGGVVLLVAAAGLAGGTHGLTQGAATSEQASSVGYQLGNHAASGGRGVNGFAATGGGKVGFSAAGGGGQGYASTGGGAQSYTSTGGGGNGMSATGGRGDGAPPTGDDASGIPPAN